MLTMRELKGLKGLIDSMRGLTGGQRLPAQRQAVYLVDVVLCGGTRKLLALYAYVSSVVRLRCGDSIELIA